MSEVKYFKLLDIETQFKLEDRVVSSQRSIQNSITTLWQIMITSLLMLHAGGVIASLTFLASKENYFYKHINYTKNALYAFMAGVLLTFICMGINYLFVFFESYKYNNFYTNILNSRSELKSLSKPPKLSCCYFISTFVVGIAAFIALLVGMYFGYNAVAT